MEDFHKGEFNSGLAIIYQLDSIEKSITQSTLDKDYSRHYLGLVAYWKTLSLMRKTDGELEYHNNKMLEVKLAVDQIIEAQTKGRKTIDTSTIMKIHMWEIELRKFKQDKGMGMPKKRDPRY